MENDIGVDSCQGIIQDDSESSLQSFLQMANGRWFENVEKAKENKTDNDEESCFGNPEHGDKKTDHLIDDDPLIISFPKKYLGIFRNPNREEEKSDERDFIDR